MKKEKTKLLFINPPQSCNIREYPNFKFPLGFLYMAGHLEKNKFKVKILDCPLYYKKRRKLGNLVKIGLFPKDIKKTIKQFNPDIVGVSCAYTAYEKDSFDIISLVRQTEKELKKKILVIVGGAHVSASPEYVLRNKEIDLAVIGEGEETVLEIAKNLQNKNLKNIKGTALIEKGKFRLNSSRAYIQNLDNLKPAWHLIDMQAYFKHPDNSSVTMRSPSVDIITSRGCPGNCVFCSIHTVWGRRWRGKTAENVVDEIEMLYKKYGVRQFRFQDDNLTFDKKRIIEICNEILKRKLDIRWDTPNGVAFWALDKEIIKKMKLAGCYRITFGIESGSRKSQEYIRKVVDMKKIAEMINYCNSLGMWVCSTFIIGFPYEKKENIEETKQFIVNSKINFPFIYIAQPLMGTDLHNDFKKEGLLKEIKQESNVNISQYNTLYFTSQQLNNMRNKIYRKFYLKKILSYANPIAFYSEFLKKITTLEELRYTIKNFSGVFREFV